MPEINGFPERSSFSASMAHLLEFLAEGNPIGLVRFTFGDLFLSQRFLERGLQRVSKSETPRILDMMSMRRPEASGWPQRG